MADWTPEVQLAVDIAFALRNVKIPGFRKGSRPLYDCSDYRRAPQALPMGVFETCGSHAIRLPSTLATTSLWNDWPLRLLLA
jgi:hypothetical protein